jgi:glutathione S-transferase
MALTLYFHPLSSFCWKVLIALYEAGTPFEGRMLDFSDAEAKADFTALWPTAKIPLLQDHGRGQVVPETSIIIEYLDQHYPGRGPLLPDDAAERLEARLWDRLSDLYVMLPMQRVVADRLRPEAERDPRTVAEAKATLRTAYSMLERQLAGRTWLAGERFTVADCAAAPALFYASVAEPFAEEQGELAGYFERLLQRPSVARAIDEARPYFQFFPLKESLPARFKAGV